METVCQQHFMVTSRPCMLGSGLVPGVASGLSAAALAASNDTYHFFIIISIFEAASTCLVLLQRTVAEHPDDFNADMVRFALVESVVLVKGPHFL